MTAEEVVEIHGFKRQEILWNQLKNAAGLIPAYYLRQ